jgi:uridine kinase
MTIVALSGCTRSGKSLLAKMLEKRLDDVKVVHQDVVCACDHTQKLNWVMVAESSLECSMTETKKLEQVSSHQFSLIFPLRCSNCIVLSSRLPTRYPG